MEADFSGNHSFYVASNLLWLCRVPCETMLLFSSDLDQNKFADKRQLSLPLQDAGQINCEIGQINCISRQALLFLLCPTMKIGLCSLQ